MGPPPHFAQVGIAPAATAPAKPLTNRPPRISPRARADGTRAQQFAPALHQSARAPAPLATPRHNAAVIATCFRSAEVVRPALAAEAPKCPARPLCQPMRRAHVGCCCAPGVYWQAWSKRAQPGKTVGIDQAG